MLGLDARYDVAAGLDEEMLGTLLEIQRRRRRRPLERPRPGRLAPRRADRGDDDRRHRAGRAAGSQARPTAIATPPVQAACAEAIEVAARLRRARRGRRPAAPGADRPRSSGRGSRSRRSRTPPARSSGACVRARSARAARLGRAVGRRRGDRRRGRARRRLRGAPRARASTTSRCSGPSARRGCCSSPRTWPQRGASSTPTASLFLRWIALHETTHVVQFERVDWLAGHLRGLAARAGRRAAAELDAGALAALARRLVRDPRGVGPRRSCAASSRGRWPIRRQLAMLDRLQATMAVIEGHAEHVMDAAAGGARRRDRGPAPAPRPAPRAARRARRGARPPARLDLKLRQYELGKAFCDRGGRARRPRGAGRGVAVARRLPDLAELERPGRLARAR